MKIKNTIRKIRKYRTPSCIKCMHSSFKPFDGTTIGYDMVGTLKVGGDAPSVCL